MPYMVTFTINIPPMLAYIPYMDPMGLFTKKHWGFDRNHWDFTKKEIGYYMPREQTGYNGKVTRYDGGVSVPHMGGTDRAVHFDSQPCIFGLPSWRTQLGSRGFTNIIRLDTNL
jgi:hypothetical protein